MPPANHPLPPGAPVQPKRRSFLKQCLAALVGATAGLFPFVAGLGVFLDPLRRRAVRGGAVKVTTLESVPPDGVPRKFPVLANRTDAWNKFTSVPIGAVYLRRSAKNELQAFNVVCPHAGCYVDFQPDAGTYLCPCHNSTFTVDGRIDSPNSPSPRGLDPLDVEVRNRTEVWVKFQNFQTGRAERIPSA